MKEKKTEYFFLIEAQQTNDKTRRILATDVDQLQGDGYKKFIIKQNLSLKEKEFKKIQIDGEKIISHACVYFIFGFC